MKKLTFTSFKQYWKVSKTETKLIFTNIHNVHIELDKETGEYLDGNLHNNEKTQILFKTLFAYSKR